MSDPPIFPLSPQSFTKLIGRTAGFIWLLLLLFTLYSNNGLASLIFLAVTCICLTLLYIGRKVSETIKNSDRAP